METKLFNDLNEFQEYLKNNPNDNCNGCTQFFLDEHKFTFEEYLKMNESNSRCWNCWECKNCVDCYGIIKGVGLENSISLALLFGKKKDEFDLTDKTVESFTFLDKKIDVKNGGINKNGWTDMIRKVLTELYQIDKNIIIKESEKNILKKPFILSKKGKQDLDGKYPYAEEFKENESIYIILTSDTNLKVNNLREFFISISEEPNSKINPDSLYFTLLSEIKYGKDKKKASEVLAVKIDKISGFNLEQINKATHKDLSVSFDRANNVEYIFSVYNGKIVQIFKSDSVRGWGWKKVGSKWKFTSDIVCTDEAIREKYIGMGVNISGSFRYLNLNELEKKYSEISTNSLFNIQLQGNDNKIKNKGMTMHGELGDNISLAEDLLDKDNNVFSRNRIVFGAPGTGKSYRLKKDCDEYFDEKHYERVTFHPNYSYSNFVGTYKPVSKDGGIKYEYVPGPFLRILKKALKNKNENYLLLIEEINRANVAAVFGDVFQLLDREDNNSSEYPIDLSEDIKRYLEGEGVQLGNGKLYIPSNMYIWATMNSADQGVFPMDTAFKRRWDFEYIGIDDAQDAFIYENKKLSDLEIPIPINKGKDDKYEIIKTKWNKSYWGKTRWNVLRKEINENLKSKNINEDKLLGPFFLSKSVLEDINKDVENYKKIIDEYDNSESDDKKKETLKNKEELENKMDKFIKLFESKVIMYLFEDVVRIHRDYIFKCDEKGKLNKIFSEICDDFEENGKDAFNIDMSKLEVRDIAEVKDKVVTSKNNNDNDNTNSELKDKTVTNN